ncbi:hypothetical protein SOVF_114990 [Spinacia oleracea]|nr:hypothetical protein SOVF_114990 [Spinacia oleracea]
MSKIKEVECTPKSKMERITLAFEHRLSLAFSRV